MRTVYNSRPYSEILVAIKVLDYEDVASRFLGFMQIVGMTLSFWLVCFSLNNFLCSTDGPTENWRKILDLKVLGLSVCTK
jgi:hypothetical protein